MKFKTVVLAIAIAGGLSAQSLSDLTIGKPTPAKEGYIAYITNNGDVAVKEYFLAPNTSWSGAGYIAPHGGQSWLRSAHDGPLPAIVAVVYADYTVVGDPAMFRRWSDFERGQADECALWEGRGTEGLRTALGDAKPTVHPPPLPAYEFGRGMALAALSDAALDMQKTDEMFLLHVRLICTEARANAAATWRAK